MRKLLSLLASLAMLTTMSPFYTEGTTDNYVDLNTLADNLGADTDYLSVVNYEHGLDRPDPADVYFDYLSKCTLLEGAYYPRSFYCTAVMAGSDMGISLLEILSHNGVISPSDIQQGAESLSEITLNEEIDKVITAYQATQCYTEFNNYKEYLVASQTYEQQVESLISTAERCMKNDRYFLITIHGYKMNHAVCGIGIAEGEWEWNGKSYDKCILALDSNNADSKGNAVGFREESCIYINSKTKESCIPAYDLDMADEPAYAVIDDDSMLNFKGAINPSVKISEDKDDITHFDFLYTKYTSVYSVRNGIKTPIAKPAYGGLNGPIAVTDVDYIHIEMEREYNRFLNFRYINTDRWIDVELEDTINRTHAEFYGTVDISDDMINIVNEGDSPIHSHLQIRMNEGTYNFSPYFLWYVNGDVNKDFAMEVVENGILLKSSGKIEMSVMPQRFITSLDGELQYDEFGVITDFASVGNSPTDNDILVTLDNEQKVVFYVDENNDGNYAAEMRKVDLTGGSPYHIISDNNVLVTVNEEHKLVCYIDDNNDGIYDSPVQKGDANYDGVINASDASAVLAQYAKLSTSSENIGSDTHTMDFDSSGIVDATDASMILAHYSDVQTS
ncbi:MAG: hypothetical protein IKJ60_04785 [Ruminococcus sp.]|nr:hypothetical protein [Ruminococcus sp.]